MSRPARLGVADWAILAVVALAGVVNLPVPFDSDQAFFTTGARQLLAGDALYRDFWDLKQPGIFWFYLVAGRLGGFHEVGVHAVELAYMTALAAVLLVTLRGAAGSPRIARLSVLLTVGLYYAAVGSNHLTQIEGLAGFPLFLALWWSLSAEDGRGGRLVRAGIAGGVALLLKLVLLPVLLGVWGVAWWAEARPREGRLASLARWAGALALGAALPLGAAGVALAAQGVLGDALSTFFLYPLRIAASTRGIGVPAFFAHGVLWFGERFSPLLALAFVGAALTLGGPADRTPRPRRMLASRLVAWTAAGLGVVVLQRKWWPYHYLLLLVPLGILAGLGIDALWRRVTAESAGRGPRAVAAAALALLFLGPATWLADKAILLRHGWPSAPDDERLAYADRFNPNYRVWFTEAALLRAPGSRPGRIYVFGDPLVYYVAGRGQALPIPGAWLEHYDATTWRTVSAELARRPPAYLVLDRHEREQVAERAPAILDLLAQRYRLVQTGPRTAWYERRTD